MLTVKRLKVKNFRHHHQQLISGILLTQWLGVGLTTALLPLAAQAEVLIETPASAAPVNPPVNPVIEVPAAPPVIIDPAPVDVGPGAVNPPATGQVPVQLPVQLPGQLQAPQLENPRQPATLGQPNSTLGNSLENRQPTDNRPTDSGDYNLGATPVPSTPRQLVINERSTGCQAILQAEQGIPSSICDVSAAIARTTGAGRYLPSADPSSPATYATAYPGGYLPQSSGAGINPDPASFSSLAAYLPRGGDWLRLAGKAMRFPLLMPAPITSAFGWRLHPISQTWRFHNGIDLGAATGTPVVAVHSGQVLAANQLGGYGLTVILTHQKQEWQTLYAHLSQITVQPGQEIRQGDLIGFVGSTGNSTGPHLHFEILQSTPEGPVAINPGSHLQFALAELIQALRVAQAKPTPVNQPGKS
jgi:murein DD-endopeptidase MepM/ murein hydrolase activator NlpD